MASSRLYHKAKRMNPKEEPGEPIELEAIKEFVARRWQEACLWLTTGSLVASLACPTLYALANCRVYSGLPASGAIGVDCNLPRGWKIYASEGLVPDEDIRRAATVLVVSPHEKWFQGGVLLHHDGGLETYGGLFPQQPMLITPTPTP